MTSINIELERIKKSFFIQRLKDEIEEIDNMDEDELDENTKAKYELIMRVHTDLTQTQKNLSTLLEDAYNNVYTKKWNKLPNYHKVQKIKEYLNEKYKSEPESKKKEIEQKLISLVQEGKLNSCRLVDYDTINKKINKVTLTKTEIY